MLQIYLPGWGGVGGVGRGGVGGVGLTLIIRLNSVLNWTCTELANWN